MVVSEEVSPVHTMNTKDHEGHEDLYKKWLLPPP
jgi:hypothetical protein